MDSEARGRSWRSSKDVSAAECRQRTVNKGRHGGKDGRGTRDECSGWQTCEGSEAEAVSVEGGNKWQRVARLAN